MNRIKREKQFMIMDIAQKEHELMLGSHFSVEIQKRLKNGKGIAIKIFTRSCLICGTESRIATETFEFCKEGIHTPFALHGYFYFFIPTPLKHHRLGVKMNFRHKF